MQGHNISYSLVRPNSRDWQIHLSLFALTDDNLTKVAEIIFAADVMSKMSLNSCSSTMVPDSKWATKFMGGTTKCTYLVTWEMAPYFNRISICAGVSFLFILVGIGFCYHYRVTSEDVGRTHFNPLILMGICGSLSVTTVIILMILQTS